MIRVTTAGQGLGGSSLRNAGVNLPHVHVFGLSERKPGASGGKVSRCDTVHPIYMGTEKSRAQVKWCSSLAGI